MKKPKSLQMFQDFFESLPDLVEETGESNYILETNHPDLPGVLVDLTTVENKPAIVLTFPGPAFHLAYANNITPRKKVYFPERIETSFHDYDEYGKYMFAAKTDKLWFFEERIAGMPNGIVCMLGMDMTAPFLDQQNWKEHK